MAFVRDSAPRRGGLRVLESYLERTLERLDDYTRLTDQRLLELERLRAIVGIRIRYQWDDNLDTVGIPAPAGFIKGNDAIEASITQFSASRFDEFGREAIVPGIFDEPISSGYVQITDFTRNTLFIYTISATTIQRPTDILLNVVNIEGVGAPPQQNDLIEASYWPPELPN